MVRIPRAVVIGTLASSVASVSLGEARGGGPAPYAELPPSLAARWNAGDCNVIWLGDSISSATYLETQSSLVTGIAEVHPNIVGFQHSYGALRQSARAAHEFKLYAGFFEAEGQTLGKPGALTNQSMGGVDGFLPVQGKTISFWSDVGDTRSLFSTTLLDSPAIAHANWWVGRDVRVDWIYYREAASNPAAIRLRSSPNHSDISNVDYMVGDQSIVAENAGANITRYESVPGGDGLCLISQLANDGQMNPDGLEATIRFYTSNNGVDETGSEIRYAMPFFQVDSVDGFRVWNAGFSGWRTSDHARATGVAGEHFYTNTAIDQFTACVAATGHPLNTIVVALGTNDGLQVNGNPLLGNVTALIDRWAVRMEEHTTDPIQVLIVTPYVFVDNDNGLITPDNMQLVADRLRITGTAGVAAGDIGVVNLKDAMGGLWFEAYDPAWPASPGNVHPSPAGANGIAQFIQDAFDRASLVADLNADGAVNGSDLAVLLAAWGECRGCPADLNVDGVVDGADLAELLAAWG